ncbi:hypothetical protein LCGC14_2832030 [marine sediment metagenome]|uniref:Uncharacterized protein n=1 Tax=marine sediment metagenome TaxID=412755 RepID=A0A0F8YDR9_9ZZZZ
MSSNDLNPELARRIAGAFNEIPIHYKDFAEAVEEVNLSRKAARNSKEIDIYDAGMLASELRESGWVVCPPLPGITIPPEAVSEKVGGPA